MVYAIGRFILNLPSRQLVEPMIVFSVLIEIGCPLIYWGRISAIKSRDYRRMFAALGILSLFYFLLTMFYGARFGVISWQTAESEAITSLITIPLMVLAGPLSIQEDCSSSPGQAR
jgi:hypothetical protein